jgi:hypothetical protein
MGETLTEFGYDPPLLTFRLKRSRRNLHSIDLPYRDHGAWQ